MNTIYLKTAKAEREGTKLPTQLRRALSLLDGRSGSDDLAKRVAPSLRKIWSELIGELVKGGYIVSSHVANIESKGRSVAKSGNELARRKLLAAERVVAALENAVAADKKRSELKAERVIAALEAAAAAGKIRSDIEPKAKTATQKTDRVSSAVAEKAKADVETKAAADAQQKAEKAARAAELKTFFAVAKEKGAAEINQLEQQAPRPRAKAPPAATATEKSTETKPAAVGKKSVQENAQTLAELEAAILASKTRSYIEEKAKADLKARSGMHVNDSAHLHDLESENEALKKLLVEAYVEIAALKARLGIKP